MRGLWRPLFWVLLALALQDLHAKGYKRVHYSGGVDDWASGIHGQEKARLAELEAAVPAGQSVLFLPVYPLYYLYCHRPAGQAAVYYYPWQEVWEFQSPDGPRADNLCTQLAQYRPAFIFDDRDEHIWNYVWKDFAPPCLDAQEMAGYVPMKGWPFWWRRRDLLFKTAAPNVQESMQVR
jgi:hypothetical protein